VTGPRNQVLVGDALTELQRLPEAFVDAVITSPPYYLLRDYGVVGQIGLEATVDDWVEQLTAVFAEVARVLKPSGALWLNVTDSYSRHPRYGAPSKSALLGPERLLLALARDGWLVRNKVVWAKTNPMPSSVGDRLNTTHELVYLLVRQRRYFFDLDAVREPHRSRAPRSGRRGAPGAPAWAGPLAGSQDGLRRPRPKGVPGHALGKNPGDVWRMSTRGFRGQHFATFPEQLVERPLLATCPAAVCSACGGAVVRFPARKLGESGGCACAAVTVPGLVLDPFFGTGTVGVVATRRGRDWLGIELNPEFARLAEERIGNVQPRSNAVDATDRSTALARVA
jgi:site-specific DNA-methyltransferase (adenine-specific)